MVVASGHTTSGPVHLRWGCLKTCASISSRQTILTMRVLNRVLATVRGEGHMWGMFSMGRHDRQGAKLDHVHVLCLPWYRLTHD